MEIEDAICSSVEDQVCRKAIETALENLPGGTSMDIDDHWVDIKGIDNISVEVL
jgi:copper chaperone CopZ